VPKTESSVTGLRDRTACKKRLQVRTQVVLVVAFVGKTAVGKAPMFAPLLSL
jgi:hypothetical protein